MVKGTNYMRKLAILAILILAPVLCRAQTTLEASLTWTATGCAATVATDTNGVEISGPCLSQIYRVSVAAGAQCPAFSTTAYTLIQAAQVENAAQAAYIDSSVTVGAVYCYAVTDTFALGGAPSTVSNTFQLPIILTGTPGTPAGLSGTVIKG